MSYLDHTVQRPPRGLAKALHLNWALVVLLAATAAVGWVMLFSVAGGSLSPWAEAQMIRFGLGLAAMFAVAMVPIGFWRAVSPLAYGGALALLVAVELVGEVGMGAQRWIDLGFMQLQPSELMKITLVMLLAAYYDRLGPERVSRPQWVVPPVVLILVPVALTLKQPDLGTAILLLAGGAMVMFAAGVSWWYFAAVGASGVGLVWAVLESRGQPWQLLEDYQYRRIDTFLDPSTDPLGAGYNITQAKIALGSGGWEGKGFLQGTQSQLNFTPETHTDFIFTVLAEEFGFLGSASLLLLYVGIVAFCLVTALSTRDRFAALLSVGVAGTFFLYFAINMAMVMGLAPVVGVPLPLVSYGGSAMMVLLGAFGLVQSAHVHRPRTP